MFCLIGLGFVDCLCCWGIRFLDCWWSCCFCIFFLCFLKNFRIWVCGNKFFFWNEILEDFIFIFVFLLEDVVRVDDIFMIDVVVIWLLWGLVMFGIVVLFCVFIGLIFIFIIFFVFCCLFSYEDEVVMIYGSGWFEGR